MVVFDSIAVVVDICSLGHLAPAEQTARGIWLRKVRTNGDECWRLQEYRLSPMIHHVLGPVLRRIRLL